MNYRIEDREGFTVVGVKEFTTMVNGENLKNIPNMWAKMPEAAAMELMALSDREPSGLLGVCAGMYGDGFDYWIAAATTKPCPADYQAMDIPPCTWAIFEAVGSIPGAIQGLFARIFSEWLPASGYEHAPAPEIEWYSQGDMASPEYKSEVWIPIVRKASGQ